MVMFSWLELIGVIEGIIKVRNSLSILCAYVPTVILYSIPDACCVYALTSCMLLFWNKQKGLIKHFWIILGPILGIGGELGQAIGIIPGVFDPTDLFLITIGIVVAFSICGNWRKINYVR